MFSHASMNRIYRLVWSDVLGTWTAVAEHTRGRGKCNRSALIAPALVALSLAGGALAAPPDPVTLPIGATVVAGTAAITQNGAAMTVTQSTQRGAIDWQTFNLGAQASVRFVQPSASSVTLNRVLDTNASQILGRISANGQVYLTNPNGVYFGAGATVDVGGLVATTHGISNADFMNGNDQFTRNGASGSVVNDGSLNAALGGYIALLAPEVRNQGVIVAQAGTVALASGEAISLQFGPGDMLAGLTVSPSTIAALVDNRQAVLAPGGRIILSAQAANRLQGGVINNSGTLEASGLVNHGGRITLEASDTIRLSGSMRADAAAGSAGNGGVVTAIADLANSASQTTFSGAISARGGELGGNGGFVDTSASHLKVADGARVDTRAPAGANGTWLLDPDGFTIAPTGGDISGATLSANLANGDVAIASTAGSGADGNVTVKDAVSWSANKLTLTATNHVNIGAVMSASGSASLDLAPTAGRVNTAFGAGNTYAGKVNFAGSGSLTIKGNLYTVINSLGADAADMTPGTLQGAQLSQNGFYALGSDIDASATAGWNDNGRMGMEQLSISWGAFDGLGHVISNPTVRNNALFASLYGNNTAELRNLGVIGGSVNIGGRTSGLVAQSWGTIANSFTTMNVTGFQYSAGMVGESHGGVILNSYATGDISGTSYVGGLVGRNYGNSVITNSYATGNITGTAAFIGGLVGNNYFGTISSSYATGNVNGNQSVGGLVGMNQAAGGQGSTLINTYATGAVNGNFNVGGLVGENGSNITNSYAVGAVSINNGNTTVGGLVGLETDQGNGSTMSVISNSFWDLQTTGQATSAGPGATGKSTADMKAMATFTGAGWNFTNTPVWAIKSAVNGGYPCLTAFANCPPSKALYVHVNGTQNGHTYGDTVGTFTYSLYDGLTLLDAAAANALGLTIDGTSLYSNTPTSTSNAGAYQVIYASGLTLGGANAGDYSLAADAGFTYTINKRVLALSGTRAYDSGTVMGVGSLSATNLVGSDCASGLSACAVTGAASVTSKNVSAGAQALNLGTLSLSGSGLDTNYTLSGAGGNASITQRTVAALATAGNRSYDGGTLAQASLAADAGLVGGDSLSFTFSGANFADKHAGTAKNVQVSGISLGGADASNYSLASSTAATQANITPLAMTVTATGVNRVYDGTRSNAVALAGDSLVTGDSVAIGATALFSDKHAGSGKTVTVSNIALSGADAQNYTLSNTTGVTSADISQRALTVSAAGVNRTYNGSNTVQATLSGNSVISGDTLVLNKTSVTMADKHAGLNKAIAVGGISISGADAGNYALQNSSASGTVNIARQSVSVMASAASRVYDGGTGASVSLALDDGVAGGDVLGTTFTSAAFANKNVGNGKTVTVQGIALAGADASNYLLESSMAQASASITPRTLQVQASGNDRAYNGGTAATVSLSDNRVAGDVLSLNHSAAFGDKNAAVGKTVSVTGLSATGADAGNYSLASTALSTSATITPRLLDIGATADSRAYNGGTGTAVTLTDDRFEGDSLTVSATGNFADKHAGAGKTVTVGNITLGGADAGNYAAGGSLSTQASITAREVSVFASGGGRVYDGSTAAPVTLTLDDSIVAGDQLGTAAASATFSDKNVGSGKAVAVSGIALTGADAGNYALVNSSAQTAGSITPRALLVTASGNDRVYNGGTSATVNLGDNRIAGDVLNLSHNASFADKNAGAGKSVSVTSLAATGADAGNYVLANSALTTSASITPRQLQLGASAASRVYDGSTGAVVALTDDRVEGDSISVSATGSFADKHAGAGKTVTVGNIVVGGTDGGNYVAASQALSTEASISKRQVSVFATGGSRVYDGSTAAPVTLTLDDGVVAGDQLATGATSAAFGDKHAGSGKTVTVSGIALQGADAGNYALVNTSAQTRGSITPRALVVSATGADRVYDGSTSATVALADNRIAGDQLTLSKADARFDSKMAGMAKAIAVSGIGMTGSDAGNYSLGATTAAASASVLPRQLLITSTGVDRVYDGSTTAAVTMADDRVAGDVLTLSASAKFVDKHAAIGKAIAVSDINAAGSDAVNYVFANTAAATASVTPRTLQVSATGVDKVFDGKLDALVKLADNRVAGDTLSLSGNASYADMAVGDAKPVTVSGIAADGADARNYQLAATTALTTAAIKPDTSVVVPQAPVSTPVLPVTTRAASPLASIGLDTGLTLPAVADTALTLPATGGAPLALPAAAAPVAATENITVTLVRGSTNSAAGMIAVDVPKQIISKGESFSFPLPKPVADALAVGGAKANVSRTDGSALPGWLKYDAQSHTFDASAAPASALPFEVKIEVDGRRWTLVVAQSSGK